MDSAALYDTYVEVKLEPVDVIWLFFGVDISYPFHFMATIELLVVS